MTASGVSGAIAQKLEHVPDMDVDLAGCGRIAENGLPPPVVVTLLRRPDRWERASSHLRQRGAGRVIKAPAVDGLVVPMATLRDLLADPGAVDRPLVEYLQLTRPAVGCFLSHLALWKRFLASDEPLMFIMEDDAVLADAATPEFARRTLAAMPSDADMLLLGCAIMDGLAERTADPAFAKVYYYNGTYGYILTRKGCRSLMELLFPLTTHVDNQISLGLVANPDRYRVYATEPRLVGHDFSVYSDVYVPVTDTARADAALTDIFARSRRTLLASGIDLLPPFDPQSQP